MDEAGWVQNRSKEKLLGRRESQLGTALDWSFTCLREPDADLTGLRAFSVTSVSNRLKLVAWRQERIKGTGLNSSPNTTLGALVNMSKSE